MSLIEWIRALFGRLAGKENLQMDVFTLFEQINNRLEKYEAEQKVLEFKLKAATTNAGRRRYDYEIERLNRKIRLESNNLTLLHDIINQEDTKESRKTNQQFAEKIRSAFGELEQSLAELAKSQLIHEAATDLQKQIDEIKIEDSSSKTSIQPTDNQPSANTTSTTSSSQQMTNPPSGNTENQNKNSGLANEN